MKKLKLIITLGLCFTFLLNCLSAEELNKNIIEYDTNGNIVHEIIEFNFDSKIKGEYFNFYNGKNKEIISINITERGKGIVKYKYNIKGNLKKIIIKNDSQNTTETFEYSKNNLLVKATWTTIVKKHQKNNSKFEEISKYDENKNKIYCKDYWYTWNTIKKDWNEKRLTQECSFKYNSNNKLIQLTDGTTFTRNFEYDEKDNLIKSTTDSVYSSIVETYTYNDMGNIEKYVSVEKSNDNITTKEMDYSYDYYENGKIKTCTVTMHEI